jgi:hypothetical protein
MCSAPIGLGVGNPLADDDAAAGADAALGSGADDDAAAGLDDAADGWPTGEGDAEVADVDAEPCVMACFECDDVQPARSNAEMPTAAQTRTSTNLDIPVNIPAWQRPGPGAGEGRILRGERSRRALVRGGNGRQP